MESVFTRQIFNLNAAEVALRMNLHDHLIDEKAKAHMERAISHVREASLSTSGDTRARTVDQLVTDLKKFERLVEAATQNAANHQKSISLQV